MTEITVKNTMGDLEKIPELQEISKYVMYNGQDGKSQKQFAGVPIAAVAEIGWSPEGMVRGMNFLIRQFAAGAKPYFVYTEAECGDDPQKRDVNIVRLAPKEIDPQKPYIILAAGGGYETVCSAAEAYSTAVHMVGRGYQVFVLTYRVGGKQVLPKALEDLASAIAVIRSHAEEYKLDPDSYAIGGFSAGANLISTWGTANAGYAAFGMPKPRAMFPVYTFIDLGSQAQKNGGHGILDTMLGDGWTPELLGKYDVSRHITAEYPPCYLVCGKDDAVVSCGNSELFKELLDQAGVPAVLEEAERAPHGFGDGTGTDVEGWPLRALDFLEKSGI